MVSPGKDEKLLASAGRLARLVGEQLDLDLSLELWDGSTVPIGTTVSDDLRISVASPGVIAALLRRPTLNRLIALYANGRIDIKGGSLMDVGERLTGKKTRRGMKAISKSRLARELLPFLFVPAEKPERSRPFEGGDVAPRGAGEEMTDYIQFHYDVGNDFYALFLDPEMQYTCAYFHDWNETLEQAQLNKMEMICRKLRLREGDRLLDIGCGWGGLSCYAARNYGVKAHGVTLSQAQVDYANEKIARLGLQDRVTVELKNYADLQGEYDKICSIGVYEHLGVANLPRYFATVRSLLAEDGLFLNHGGTRRAARGKRRFGTRPEHRAIRRYVFPGGELDDIGNTVSVMEQQGFEVRDVESWRDHYFPTIRMWCDRLAANRDKAIELVGEPIYRMWVAYLSGCGLALARGSIRKYQVLVTKSAERPAPLPPTRADLYR
ncbi:MAG: cyclopropane-fatty-acyl-phospholipid synthase family protein [Hyphomicrobiales bacterium]|nr:cyclopropane-fatty-acyl-phospholipid synthase family protein [Hyphomicrobiales bacterium]